MKEYVVTLKNIKDKESFCNEMLDTRPINKNIPLRTCQISSDNTFSPNVIFYLDEKEAEELKKDPRILDVAEPLDMTKFSLKNHEILPELKKNEISSLAVTGSTYARVIGLPDGSDVDVVIMDGGHSNPSHPEFSKNQDGSGGSRINQINWYTYTNSPSNNYVYTSSPPSVAYPENHPCHVGGTAAGNTQGWAKKSNIYNINYDWWFNNTWVPPSAVVGFHSSKTINPNYGNKNPTVVNMSFGFMTPLIPKESILRVVYRGQIIDRPTGGFSQAQLISWGIVTNNSGNVIEHGVSNTALNAEISNMINNGIIVVASAGNSYWKMDIPGGADYNNYYIYTDSNGINRLEYYHRGGCPAMVDGVICVGALGSEIYNGPMYQEFKANFSNTGPRVDIYAPGKNIISSLNKYDANWGAVNDQRNSSFYLGKTNGTSMASPQVTGMVACRLQNNRTMTPAQARAFIINNSTSSMGNTFGMYEDFQSLLDGNQKVAYYPGITVQ